MRISRVITTVVVATAAALSLSSCGFFSEADSISSNNLLSSVEIKEFQSQELGKALKAYGYTPVAFLFDAPEDTVPNYVYVACGDTDPAECGKDVHNRGTNEHPNIYVKEGKVVKLEGPHTSDNDDRSYYVTVPKAKSAHDKDYQDFATLSKEDQEKLLGVMPKVAEAMGNPSAFNHDPTRGVVMTDIGHVDAWVSRL